MPPPIPRGVAPPPLCKTQIAASNLSPLHSALSPSSAPSSAPIRALTPPPFPSSPTSPTSSSLSPHPSRSRFGTLRVSAATLHSESESSLLTQFSALKETTTNRAAARKIARNRDTIATLLEAIRSKPNFTKMVEYSLECLRNLAVDEGSVEEMLEEHVVETVLTVLKLNPYNEKIQSMANALLSSFVINDNTAAVVGNKTYATHTHTHSTSTPTDQHPLTPSSLHSSIEISFAAMAEVRLRSSTPCASTSRAAR